MNPLLDETRALALRFAGDARTGLQSGLRGAARTVGTAIDPVVLRKGGRQMATAVRRNPLATTAALATVLGAGVALWMLRRNRRQAPDERLRHDDDTIELVPSTARGKTRAARKRARAATA